MTHYNKSDFMQVINTFGRCLSHEDALYFNWTNAAFETEFTGKLLTASFKFAADKRMIVKPGPMGSSTTVTLPDYPNLAVFIDGAEEPVKRLVPSGLQESFVLFSSEQVETHIIRVVKLTENFRTNAGLVSLDFDGSLKKPVKSAKKIIEFLGDSITCGFGNEAPDMNAPFITAEENGHLSYGPIAARELGMDYQMMCISGITLGKYDEFPMPYAVENLYEYTDKVGQDRLRGLEPMDQEAYKNAAPFDHEKWNFKEYPVDYVAINLGTNDATVTRFGDHRKIEREFVQKYVDFLKLVRNCNGQETHIIVSLGCMCYYLYGEILDAVNIYKKETGDDNLSVLRYTKMLLGGPDAGGCAHPSVEMDRHMAAELVEHIKSLEK